MSCQPTPAVGVAIEAKVAHLQRCWTSQSDDLPKTLYHDVSRDLELLTVLLKRINRMNTDSDVEVGKRFDRCFSKALDDVFEKVEPLSAVVQALSECEKHTTRTRGVSPASSIGSCRRWSGSRRSPRTERVWKLRMGLQEAKATLVTALISSQE